MKFCLIALALLCASTPSFSGDPLDPFGLMETHAFRDRINHCLSTFLFLNPFRPFDPANVQSEFLESLPHQDPLSRTELALIGKIHSITGYDAEALQFLKHYRGERKDLMRTLEWNLNRLQETDRAKIKNVSLTRWIDSEGFEEVRALFKKYEDLGWRFEVSIPRIDGSPTKASKILFKKKKVIFRVALTEIPLPFVVARTLYRLEAMRLIQHNQNRVKRWIQSRMEAVVLKEMNSLAFPRMDTEWEWDWDTLAVTPREALEKTKIPNEDIKDAGRFLVEREALIRTFELYLKTTESHPEWKYQDWERSRFAADPKFDLQKNLNEAEFGFKTQYLDAFGMRTLQETVETLAGSTLEQIDQPKKRSTLQELVGNKPKFFIETQTDPIHYLNYFNQMKVEEAEMIVRYLTDISVSGYPWDPKTYDYHLNRELESGIKILSFYDAHYRTNYAVEAGSQIVKNLKANPSIGNFSKVFSAFGEAASNARDPRAMRTFLESTFASDAVDGFLLGPNLEYRWESILNRLAEFENEKMRPDADLLSWLLSQSINRPLLKSKTTEKFNTAIKIAKDAQNYFTTLGDLKHSAEFQKMKLFLMVEIEEHKNPTNPMKTHHDSH